MSEDFTDSESECSFDGVENEPMFAVLSQFLVTNKNKNIAQVLADIANELKQINVSLSAMALQHTHVANNTNSTINATNNAVKKTNNNINNNDN
jgi:hypothetical protein